MALGTILRALLFFQEQLVYRREFGVMICISAFDSS